LKGEKQIFKLEVWGLHEKKEKAQNLKNPVGRGGENGQQAGVTMWGGKIGLNHTNQVSPHKNHPWKPECMELDRRGRTNP